MAPENGQSSSKMVKARALVEKGAKLTVMTENEFFAAIEE